MDNNLEKFFKLSLKFLTPLNLSETYKFIVDEAIKLTRAKHGSLIILQGDNLKRIYATSPEFYKVKLLKRDFYYRVLKNQKPLILDSSKNKAGLQRILPNENFHSGIILPLINQNQPMGIIVLISPKNKQFNEAHTGLLKYFTPLAVNAMKKAQISDQSQKALEARDLFISMAAHELRTPLTTINGYAQLLYSKWSSANTTESKWIEELTMESYRLTQLLNELLELNRIKTGQLHYIWTEVSLIQAVNQALRDFRFTHPSNKVTLKNKLEDSPDKVIGDYNKLLQVIINLLDNAAKFSPAEKKITVTLFNSEDDVILEVRDQGRGIPKKELRLIFEMFYRGSDHTLEGMGVGLFLAKNIITHHKGSIYIKSKKGHGTTIGFKLPRIRI